MKPLVIVNYTDKKSTKKPELEKFTGDQSLDKETRLGLFQ